MGRLKKKACQGLFFAVLLPCLFAPQAKNPPTTEDSGREFVQEFYDWYVPKTQFEELRKHSGTALDRALKERTAAFNPELAREIEKAQAESRRNGEVFLDFDPILNSQDPGERYVAGNVLPKGASYWVEVFGVFAGRKDEKPDVLAEVQLRNGRWFFVNFHYPNAGRGSGDLVSILRSQRGDQRNLSK